MADSKHYEFVKKKFNFRKMFEKFLLLASYKIVLIESRSITI